MSEYDYGDTAFTPSGFPGPVEVVGRVHRPTNLSTGPFPLIVFLHGRHGVCESGFFTWPCPSGQPIRSYRGYDYVASVLASHGYIVVSIGANGINARDNSVFDLGAQARAELIQHHLDRWNTFNTTGAAPFGTTFVGKVDLDNVGTMGHSRGGEGVMRHFLYNLSLGSPYTVNAVFPLAPVDFNRPIINNVPFEVLLPYCDGDVSDLQGVHFYDDARYSASGDMTPKHYVYVMGANHNFYNTVWTPPAIGASDDWGGVIGDSHCDQGQPRRLTAAQQRGTGLAYMTGFFRRYLGGEMQFDPMLKGDVPAPPSAMTNDLFSSYHAPDIAAERRDVNRLLVASHLTTNHLGGAASRTGFTPYDLCGGESPQPQHCLAQSSFRQPHTTPSARSSARGLSQLRGGWTGANATYTNNLPAGTRDISQFQVFQFRAGVNFEDARNPTGAAQDFRVRLTDGTGASADVLVSAFSDALFYPPGSFVAEVPKVLLNTIRLPLSAFSGVNLSDVRSVQFRFNETSSGALLITDLAFADSGSSPGLPDLVETAVSNPPATVAPGGSFMVTDTAQNQGVAGAGSSTTGYYLSLDAVKSGGDVLLTGTRSVPALGVGASDTGSTTVTVPGGTVADTYFLLACADDTGVVVESNNGNNCIASATTVEVQGGGSPDLVVTAVSNPPATAPVGGAFSVTDITGNQGAASTLIKSKTRYYFSTDATKSANDKRLAGAHGVPVLAAGASHTKTRNVTIRASTVPGTYFLIACADDTKKVAESDESNQCTTSMTTIVVTP
jgi:hypothetical protein